MTSFDSIIIGAGQAGPFLAGRLTKAGMTVALVERKLFGGTCVNTGTDPSNCGTCGNVCVGDPGDVNGTFTFQYQWTFYGPAAGTCATIPNTATFADNSIPQSTGSAGASVRLCSFSARLTPGY